MKSAASLTVLDQLFNIDVSTKLKLANHEEQVLNDLFYEKIVSDLYHTLVSKTAHGIATARIMQAHMTDGVIAWNNLVKFYKFLGNRDSFAYGKLKELNSFQYHSSSAGSMDAYINKFEHLCVDTENTVKVLSNVMKKTLFLNGINEPVFTSMKDVLHDAMLEETLIEIRKKALSLKPPPTNPYTPGINVGIITNNKSLPGIRKMVKTRRNR